MADTSYLHSWHHDDYDRVKRDIFQQIGDYENEVEAFGRQVLCAVYVRPLWKPGAGLRSTDKQQWEDVYQGKTMMVLKLGPDAFSGTPEWVLSQYGPRGAPTVGDWLYTHANDGMALSIEGANARRVREQDRREELENLYPFSGWQCRIIQDDRFIGRVLKPHMVV